MSTQAIQLKVQELDKMTLPVMLEDERVSEKFVQLYNNIHGEKVGDMIYHKEKFNFIRQVSEKPDLKECSKLSLYGAFIDMAVSGLSLEQGSKPLAYLLTRNVKIKKPDGSDGWEKRAYLTVSPYGELVMRMRAGQIRHADNPVIVYEGDIFEPELATNGDKVIRYKPAIPRTSKKIIGSFIRITRNDGTTDLQWLLEDDIKRLQGYSARQNKNTSGNALYSSNDGQIDTGFLEAKTIKHAFRTYPKVRTGNMTQLETEQIPENIDYGITDENGKVEQVFGHSETFDEAQVETVVAADDDGVF